MKAGFGLVALMVSIGILAYLWSLNTTAVVQQAQPAQRQAERFSGFDESGKRAKDTIKLEPFSANGKLRYLLVTDIDAGGAMQTWYGLKRDDQILAVGPMDVRGETDALMVTALMDESRQRNYELKVRRDGSEYKVWNVDDRPVWTLTKPGEGMVPAPETAGQQPTGTPAPGSAQPNETPARDTTKALNRQLEKIPGIQR